MYDPYDEQHIRPARPRLIGRARALYSGRRALPLTVATAVGALALAILFGFLLMRAEQAGPAATPTPEGGPQAGPAGDTYLIEAVSGSEAISITLETPAFLTVAGTDFSVASEVLPEVGAWNPAVSGETTAVWAYGTVINYVFGLEASAANRALLDSLAVADEIVISADSGASTTFAVSSRELFDSGNRDLFAQRSPSVTLILISAQPDEQRLVVTGRYVSSGEEAPAGAGRVVEIGQTAQLENLQITVNSVSYLYNRPEAPAGFAFFLIDYQFQNVGAEAVEPAELSLVLADELGNLYALNPVASQLGNFPPLSESVAPGPLIQATAGYQIPAGLSTPLLRWQVSRLDTGSQIQVNIAFGQVVGQGEQAAVEVEGAEVSLDGASLMIEGEITNLSEQPLVVDANEMSLVSDGAVFLVVATSPAFPWVVSPGESLAYALTFQRPPGSAAVFTVANQPFQLNGLR